MNPSLPEKLALLEQFDSGIQRWFDGTVDQGDKEALRKSLNEMAPMARALVREARCLKLVSVSPPAAIGGPVIRNADPFDMLFESYYGMSFIPTIRDMTQQAIGVLRSGRLDEVKGEPQKAEPVVYKELPVPEKVTLIWLLHHVPVKLWAVAAAALFSAFAFGIEASKWSFVKEILHLSQ